jgi:hypothetical protein
MPPATFAGEVGRIFARHEQEKWRMGVLRGLAYWREFVSGWLASSDPLRSACPTLDVPEDVLARGDRDVLAWAWGSVYHEANAVLMGVDTMTSIPSACIVSHFRVLSGSGLIVPDGRCCSYVVRAVERTISREEATENRAIADSAYSSARLRGAMDRKKDPKRR